MDDEKEYALDSLRYYWRDKQDLERCTNYEEYVAHFPEIKHAWENYKMAEKILTAVINGVKV